MLRSLRRSLFVTIAVLILSLLSIIPVAASGPGDLDVTFDADGKQTTDFGGAGDVGYAVAIQNDGKIVVGGYSDVGADFDFAVARYLVNGTLDPSFGGGPVTTDIGSTDRATSVAIQSDGKIVLVGTSGSGIGIARYNTDGSLDDNADGDPSVVFGTSGISITSAVGSFATSVAIQSNGKIVVASGTSVLRYDGLSATGTPGTLDSSFGTGGIVTTPAGVTVRALVIQSDGKIVVAGGDDDFFLARYNTDGSLDDNADGDPLVVFGTGGSVTSDFGSISEGAWAMLVQPDGKLVVAGASGDNFIIARYHGTGTPGTLDSSFGSGGSAARLFNGIPGYGTSIAMQSDGKIVMVGTNAAGFIGDFALMRYNANGTLDTSFGTGGEVATDFGGPTDVSAGVAIQADGKIVVSGTFDAGLGGPYDFAVARYWPNTDVVPTPVPGVSTWGMGALALMLGGLVFGRWRRRSRNATA